MVLRFKKKKVKCMNKNTSPSKAKEGRFTLLPVPHDKASGMKLGE